MTIEQLPIRRFLATERPGVARSLRYVPDPQLITGRDVPHTQPNWTEHMRRDGTEDMARAAEALAMRLPADLAALARLAYNYWWSWAPGGAELFRSLDPARWEQTGEQPVRLLQEISTPRLARLASDINVVGRARSLVRELDAELARPATAGPIPADRPAAFLCAEFGIHRSLPLYAGGLGILAGDFIKEVSDRALPFVAVGLMYSQGYFHQRLDTSGWQHEYWTPTDADRLPAALVRGEDGLPLTITVPIRGRDVVAQIWRVDAGRVPLYLLDTDRPENLRIDRWITSRLYVSDRHTRLAQYALLGLGGVRALRAMGIDPSLVFLNEGHAALASVEFALEGVVADQSLEQALAAARERTMFITHTPVPAGNDVFSPDEVRDVLGDLPAALGITAEQFLALGRVRPEDSNEPLGMTPLALRTSRGANGVSRRHGEVSRAMWQPLWPERTVEQTPIGHVTNGVHISTWMATEMRGLLDRYLGPGWEELAADPLIWEGIDQIPDEELWSVRCRLREQFVTYIRDRSVGDRLARGEAAGFVEAAARAFDPNVLTLGFARRVATYKRLYLLSYDLSRGLRVISGARPAQLVIAGKGHPQDDEAKRTVQRMFGFKEAPNVGGRVVYLEDYDMAMGARLVRGCDVWINVPRPPMEASGTSGMKSVLNGGLQLSVLDGWWSEAFDGTNGWGIEAREDLNAADQDARDAATLFDLLEDEVIPLFYTRDQGGIPRGWVQRIKRSMKTIGPNFNTARMVQDYLARIVATAPAQ